MTAVGLRSTRLIAGDETSAVEAMHAAGLTDGLPVVVPTEERVEHMLLGVDLDADVEIGRLGPSNDVATLEKVAINAVMAGCLPEHLPVLVAAVEAVADPLFNLGAIQTTTFASAPLIVVNGPVRHEIDLASGTGALGPGHRANASIGRALRLLLMNVGRGHPGVGDMALLGTPAGYASCLAEAEESSPFEPLHVARGFGVTDSVVTVIALEAPRSVLSVPETGAVDASAERLLTSIASSLSNLGSNQAHTRRGHVAVVLNPMHAATLADAGHDRHSVQAAIFERSGNRRSIVRAIRPMYVDDGPDEVFRPTRDAGEIVVVVAGGDGNYSATMTSWGGGPDGCLPVSRRVRRVEACDIG